MAIFIPKSDTDGSGLGLASQRWTFIHVSSSYATSSYINGTEISSGSQGLMADGHPLLVSPFHIDNFPSLEPNQVAIRLNNLLPSDGDYNLGGFKITNAGYPSSNNDVANKLYVDNTVQGIKWKNSVKAASEPNGTSYFVKFVNSTFSSNEGGGFNRDTIGTPGWDYASGSAGEGATLTFKIPKYNATDQHHPASNINGGTWQWVSNLDGSQTVVDHGNDLFDGVNDLIVDDRILIKNFGPPYEGWNGIYKVQSTGSANILLSPTNPILVRAEDFNSGSEAPAAAVAVEEGNVNADIAYMCTVDTDTVEGQDLGDYPLVFSVFGHQTADNVTIYKDSTQNNRFEVTGVLRDINDLFYDYATPARIDVPDGTFLVGDGTSFVSESNNTARTSLGLGTGSNVKFNSLELTDALTASVITSPTDTITLKDRLESAFPLTASHLFVTHDASIGSLVSRDYIIAVSNITAGGQITATGDFFTTNGDFETTNGSFETTAGSFTTADGNFVTTNGRVNAPFITASVALSASQILLPSFDAASELPAGSSVETNFLYNIDGQLFFNGGAVGGADGVSVKTMAFQDHENVFIHGGNIFSHSPANEGAALNRFVRLGVSGSNLDGTYAGTTDRQDGLRIVEGSFIYLSASNAEISGSYGQFDVLSGTTADINGGTIDGTNIGLEIAGKGEFTELTASDIDINGGTLSDITIDGNWTAAGQTCAELTASIVDINGGTIDGTDITVGSGKTLNVADGTLTLAAGQVPAAKVSGGIFDSGVYRFDDSSQLTASHVNFTNLDVDNLTADAVDINGGVLSNVIVDETCTIQIDNADYNNLTASHLKIEDSLDLTLTGSQVSRIQGTLLVVDGQNAIFDNGVFNVLTGAVVDIHGGSIVGTDIGVGGLKATGSFNELTASIGIIAELTASDIKIDDGTATFSALTASVVDINGGTIDGTLIGTETPAKGVFNMLTSSDGVLTASHVRFGGASGGDIYIKGHQGVNSLVDVNYITGSGVRAKDYFEFGPGGTLFSMNYAPIQRLYTIPTSSHGNSSATYQNYAVNRKYIDYVITQKISVDTVAESNIASFSNLATTYSGHDINDGDRILLKGQSDASENGIYFNDNGNLFRSHDLVAGSRASGITVFVTQGGFAGAAFICTSAKNADIVGTHDLSFETGGGVYNAGIGLDKDISANSFFVNIKEDENLLNTLNHADRANLDFNSAGELILSSSIHTTKAKFEELIATTADINDGTIDNTVIGGTDPSDAAFNSVVINTQLSSSLGSKIIMSKGEFDGIEVYDALETSTFTNERLVHISGTLQLASKASAPSNKSNRLYNQQGNLYWQNNLLSSTDGKGEYETLYVKGLNAGDGLFVSGTLTVGPEELPGTDTYAFISGAIGSRNGSTRGVTVLGGDTVISGNLYVGGSQVSAGGNPAADNITEGDDNVDLVTSAGNVTVRSGPGGNLTLSGSTVTLDSDSSSITVGASLIPDVHNQYDLGSNAKKWNDLHLSNDGRILFGDLADVVLEALEPGTLKLSVATDDFADPELQIYSGFNGETGPKLRFLHDSSSPAPGDMIGIIAFDGQNSDSDVAFYGKIATKITSPTDESERSDLLFSVQAGGDLTSGLVLSGTNTAGVSTVDISDHNGSTGGLKLGGTLLTVTGSELNLLDGDTVTAASGSSLRWDGAQMQWEKFDGGAATANQITEGNAAINLTTSTGNVTVKSGPGDTLVLSGTNITMRADQGITIASGAGNPIVTNSSGQITKLVNSTAVDSNNYYLTWDDNLNIAKWQTWRGFKHNRIEAGTATNAAFGNHYSFEFDKIQDDHELILPAIVSSTAGFEIRVLIKTNHSDGAVLTISTNGSDKILNIDTDAGQPIESQLNFDATPESVVGTSFTLISDGNNQWEMM